LLKILRKQLYSPFLVILLIFLYIFLPIYLACQSRPHPFPALSLFYLANLVTIFYLLKKSSLKKDHLRIVSQDLQEKLNILKDQNSRELSNTAALQEKIRRYNNLKKIIEEVNQNLSLEAIANQLAEASFVVIGAHKGICILYLVDTQSQTLSLFKAKKEDEKLIIKAKEGDIFDLWVLKHTSPLFIEEIKKDFRFDLEKLKSEIYLRPFSSLISSPLISDHRFLGLLRLDNPVPNFYAQDDLRFLVAICDLGAVALENGKLFQETQDLAIHDGLTSLFTKGYFLERLKEEYKRSIRQNTAISLLMLDIDYFKKYNDKFGHTAGDIVLKNLSQNIVGFLGDLRPIISRFGGEEFCIILPHVDKKEACKIAEELRADIEKKKIILRRQETNITISIGVANFPLDVRDDDELLLKADKAMYKAKQKGRNRVVSA